VNARCIIESAGIISLGYHIDGRIICPAQCGSLCSHCVGAGICDLCTSSNHAVYDVLDLMDCGVLRAVFVLTPWTLLIVSLFLMSNKLN